MDNTTSLDPRAKFWARIASGAAILGVSFVVAPYVWIALGGLAGLIAAGAVLLTTWMLLPAIQNAAANLRLKLVKAEAARNPVETLQLEHQRQSQMLEERKAAIETMSGAIRTLAEAIQKLAREFPDSPELEQMKQDYADLRSIEQSRMDGWKEAYSTLGEFAKEIKRAARIWDVATAMAKARGASGLSEEEWQAKMKAETSFDAIRTKLNTEMSALNTEKMQADADRILKGKTAASRAESTSTPSRLAPKTQLS
jgi:hypothetical protein